MQILATTSSPQKMNPPTIDESNAAEPGTVTVTEDLSLTKPDTTVLIDNSKKSDTVPSKTTAKKPELNNPAPVDIAITVSRDVFKKNLSLCATSKITDKDYGLYPSDIIESELTTLEWSSEILGGTAESCKVSFGAAFYDSTPTKRLDKTIVCTFNFSGQTENQINSLINDAEGMFTYNLLTVDDIDKLSPAEKMFYDKEMQGSAKIDPKILQEYTELDLVNKDRITCSDTSVVINE